MKIALKLILGLVLVLTAVPLWTQPSHADVSSHSEVHKKYRCPMHHQVVSDKPGNCPICGMTLVLFDPDAKESRENRAVVSVDAEKQRLIGIKIALAEKRPLQKMIRALGVVSHEEMLYEAQLEYVEALRNAPNAVKEKYGTTYQKPFVPTALETARLKLRQMGMDDESISTLNRTNPPDKALLHLGDHEEDWVSFTIYEYESSFVKKGDSVEVEIPAFPGVRLQGEVRMVSPFVDETGRTLKGRALVRDEKHRLKPQMSVTVIIHADMGTGIAVPLDAVLMTGTRSVVYVQTKEGVFEPRNVVVGAQAGEFYEIKEGLMEGEKVVVKGNFLIDSESRLSEPAGMS